MTDHPERRTDFNAAGDQAGQTADVAASPPQEGGERPKHPPPFSVRFSADEREWLRQQAKDGSIGAFIRRRVLARAKLDAPARTHNGPVAEHRELAHVLAQLGRSTLASNVNQLAKALHTGTLEAGPETEAALYQACADIAAMRAALMQALGTRKPGP